MCIEPILRKLFSNESFGLGFGLSTQYYFLNVFRFSVFCKYNVPMTVEVEEPLKEEENGNVLLEKKEENGGRELLDMDNVQDTDKML